MGRYGLPHERLGALGSLAAGTYFWTNATATNARIASVQARNLSARLTRHPAPA